MSVEWSYRGVIEASTVTQLALSPGFAQDRTLLAGTLAGVSVSHDRGETWLSPSRGVVGPLVRDIAFSPRFSNDHTMFASAPGGLFRSTDGGRSWSAAKQGFLAGALVIAPDGTLYVVPEGDTRVWRGSVASLQIEPVGCLPYVAVSLHVDADGLLWAITERGVSLSLDRGASWQSLALPAAWNCQALAFCGREWVAIGTEENGLWLYWRTGRWQPQAELEALGVTSLAVSGDGSVLAAGTQHGVFVSSDRGLTWVAPTECVPVLSIAMAPDAGRIYAGLAASGCHHSLDLGAHWEALPGMRGTLVSELHSDAQRTIARTVDGSAIQSPNGGRTWRPVFPDGTVQVVAVTSCADSGFYVATNDGRVLNGAEIRPPVRSDIRALAVADQPGAYPFIAVADAREVMLTANRGETWTIDAPSLENGREIVDVAFGRPGKQPVPLLAAVTLAPDGIGELWLRTAQGAWRSSVAQQTGGAGIHLATIGGRRGVFAAVGATVYRPARVGALVFSGEWPAGQDGCAFLRLAAVRRPSGSVVLAALSAQSLYLSRDGGLTWMSCDGPPGAPITAITLQGATGELEVLAAQVGGSVLAFSIADT
jgi:hypothetical protein